jgi:twitching motility two-component system response regulator PilG
LPTAEPAQLSDALQLIRAGRNMAARNVLRDILSLEPRNEEAHIWAAVVSETHEEAIALLEHVLQINPANALARKSLASYKPAAEAEAAHESGSPPQHGPRCPVCDSQQTGAGEAILCASCGCAHTLRDHKAARVQPGAQEAIVEAALLRHQKLLEKNDDPQTLIAAALACLGLNRSGDAYLHLKRAEANCWNDYHLRTLRENLESQKPILVVEESPTTRRSICQSLEEQGFRARAANRGREAYGKVVEEVPGLILIDASLPDMQGHELARAIRRNKAGREVPIIMISNGDGLLDRMFSRVNGIKDYLAKPIQIACLQQTILKYIRPDVAAQGLAF